MANIRTTFVNACKLIDVGASSPAGIEIHVAPYFLASLIHLVEDKEFSQGWCRNIHYPAGSRVTDNIFNVVLSTRNYRGYVLYQL